MSYKVGNYGLVNLNLQLMSFLVWGAEQQPPKDVFVLIPRTCDYVDTWQGGSMTADGIKAADQPTLRWGDYPELSGGSNVITRVLLSERGKLEGQSQREI